MRLPHRLQGQKVKSQGHGVEAYCGGHLAAQLHSGTTNRAATWRTAADITSLKSIYNNRTGFDLPSDRSYLVQRKGKKVKAVYSS